MKIIIGVNGSDINEHARKLVRASGHLDMMPKGVPVHKAKFPLDCESCGETFWSKDEYAVHPGCKGSGTGVGFSY